MTQPSKNLPASIGSRRDEALRKIGRNVVGFQKIESLLKSLVLWGNFSGEPHRLQQMQAKRAKFLEKKSLGDVADTYHQNVFGGNASESASEDPSAFHISVRVEYQMDAEMVRRQKRNLRLLVAERNRLIHKDLIEVDFHSEESCSKLIEKLDEQYGRVQKQFKLLQDAWSGIQEFHKELLRLHESGELVSAMNSERDFIR